jgi:hypothetical protein
VLGTKLGESLGMEMMLGAREVRRDFAREVRWDCTRNVRWDCVRIVRDCTNYKFAFEGTKLGISLGALVDLTESVPQGELCDADVADTLGELHGTDHQLGAPAGPSLGAAEGTSDGEAVGTVEGTSDGWELGTAEGTSDMSLVRKRAS